MDPKEEESRARYRYLQLKSKAAESQPVPADMKDAPAEAAPSGILNSLTTTDLEGASKFDPFAQAARLGQFANKGNQQLASGIAEGAGTLGASAERAGLPAIGRGIRDAGVIAGGALGTASEFLLPQNRLGVAGVALSPLMKGYQALRGPAKVGGKPGIVAQLGSARTKVPAGDIQQAINDPSVFQAATVSEANKAYGAAAGPLQSAARSLRTQTGKVLLGEADWSEAINRPGRILAGAEIDAAGNAVPMDSQTALEGVQSINRFMRNKVNTAKLDGEQLSELIKQKDSLLTFLESNGTTGMREAAMGLRKAHVNENLSRIMPQNKYGGTDALRTMGAGATIAGAGSLALAGYPLAAVPLALEALTTSPAVLGGAIRNYQAVTNPAVIGKAAPIFVVRPSKVAEEYNRR